MLDFLLGFMVVLISVGVHYEGLRICSRLIRIRRLHLHRLAVAFAIIGALIAHMVEILIFAASSELMVAMGIGGLRPAHESFNDLLYYSAVTYTSLGFGDVIPTGAMRTLSGLEALTGLVMIAWTASFSFLQMEHFWRDR